MGDAFKEIGFIHTGIGAHGLYPSRDGTELYVANRGSHSTQGRPHGRGSIAVIDFVTNKIEHTWPIPGGFSVTILNALASSRMTTATVSDVKFEWGVTELASVHRDRA